MDSRWVPQPGVRLLTTQEIFRTNYYSVSFYSRTVQYRTNDVDRDAILVLDTWTRPPVFNSESLAHQISSNNTFYKEKDNSNQGQCGILDRNPLSKEAYDQQSPIGVAYTFTNIFPVSFSIRPPILEPLGKTTLKRSYRWGLYEVLISKTRSY